MISRLNQHTIPQTDSEALKEALAKTKNKTLARMIRAELESRKAAGVNRPLSIEDFLG